MNPLPAWRSIISRLFLVLILLIPLGITAPGAEIVQASQGTVAVQQTAPPIDNALGGDPMEGFIPAAENPYKNLVGEANGPDISVPGPIDFQPLEEAPVELLPALEQIPNLEGPLDLSLPENEGLTPTPFEAPVQAPSEPTPVDPALDLTIANPLSEVTGANELESISGLSGNLDDFNRANGPLGGAWTDKVAGIMIASDLAQTSLGATAYSLSIHTHVSANEAKARIFSGGSGVSQYTGFVFNYADGQDHIFIKIQDNDSDGLFDTGACYKSNGAGAGFGLGFFYLSGTFSSATLQVTVSANRSVGIALTDLAGGGANQNYLCAGAPAVNGSQFGIVSYGGGQLDNVTVQAVDPKPLTTFTDQDGPLGSDWWVHAGEFRIQQQRALSQSGSLSLATYNSLGANQIEADVSINPGGGAQYAGLVLNYDEGVNNLFLKVQDNDGDGTFEHGACYIANNNSGAPFGLGFFSLSFPFSHAHLTVSVTDDRVAHISLTHIDGGSGSQYYECAGAPPIEGHGVGIASWGGGRVDNFQVVQDFRDNFNRADGPLGSNWAVRDGTYAIVSQKAKGTSGFARATYNGIGANQIEADVSLSPTGLNQYSALMLDYGAGTSNLFIKVQDNNGGGSFNTAGCYLGNNGDGFGLSFFNLSAPFTTAHMVVSVDASRLVTLVFTNIDGESDTQAYVCGVAPTAEGPYVGIASWQGGLIDNVRVKRVFGLDSFNRPTGSLGPSWETQAGTMALVDQGARGTSTGSSLTIFKNVTGNQVEGDITASTVAGTNFSAFILNYGAGVDNLFIKFQNQDADPAFEKIGCYLGNNDSGRQFGPGFFTIASPVNTAHVKIWVNAARTVTILLTRIDGGTGMQLYTCAGAPPAEGDLVGIASYNGGRIDNLMASGYVPTLDAFLPMIIR